MYFKWWKSWASGEGKNGKWKPECAFKVDKVAMTNQSHAVAVCDPKIKGPEKCNDLSSTQYMHCTL